MNKQISSLLYALGFFTRIPVKIKPDNDLRVADGAIKYLPAAGLVVGAISSLVMWLSMFVFPQSLSVILMLLTGILITGAFHEDGLADVSDGLGGGSTPSRKLEIMKDSHIGTYGVIALIFVLLTKFVLLSEIISGKIFLMIISAHSISRLAALFVMRTHIYVRAESQSKVLPIIKKPSYSDMIIAGTIGLSPLLFFQNIYFLLMIIPVWLTQWVIGISFKKQTGGYTGDCLGAVQQICEVVFYIGCYILWKYFL